MNVAFFGHSDTPNTMKSRLKEVINSLITENTEITFYVGNQGNFDKMAASILEEYQKIYPHIKCFIVLAYMPENNDTEFNIDTIFPEKVAVAPKKFAISKRNDWLIDNCDIVISYITRNIGGAAKFTEKAKKKNKTVINISEQN